MSHSKEELIKYRLSRAESTLDEAKVMLEIEHWNTAVNRLYYACFYAVSAYMAFVEIKANTHTGTKAKFNETLIKTELLTLEHSQLYNKLFVLRNKADYKDFIEFTEERITPLLPQSQAFVQAISELIKNANNA